MSTTVQARQLYVNPVEADGKDMVIRLTITDPVFSRGTRVPVAQDWSVVVRSLDGVTPVTDSGHTATVVRCRDGVGELRIPISSLGLILEAYLCQDGGDSRMVVTLPKVWWQDLQGAG